VQQALGSQQRSDTLEALSFALRLSRSQAANRIRLAWLSKAANAFD